jgi:hypothetical protein
MKKLYSKFIVFTIVATAIIPSANFAQCSCPNGVAPSVTSYLDVIKPTNASSITLSFPQFDSTKGKLGCVSFKDTISGATTAYIQNLASTKTQYAFLFTVANSITGPGISVNENFTKNYGPDSLNAYGNHPGDSIVYGPANVFTNIKDSTYTSNTAGYIGKGAVNYTYTLNGGFVSTKGSLNYSDQVVTNYWGSFRLSYYWCPLSQNDPNNCGFNVYHKGHYVEVDWQTHNEKSHCNYEVQCSNDGSNYIPVCNKQSAVSEQDTASYQYQFPLQTNSTGILHFRVKRNDSDSNIFYTTIKSINLNDRAKAGCTVYPNPVKNSTMMEFDEAQYGTFMVFLINQSGQIVLKKQVTLTGTNQIKINIFQHLTPGIYLLQANDQTNLLQYSNKVFIQ